MTALPPGTTLAWLLISNGVPPALLIDLLDPTGMKLALAEELLPSDIAAAPAPVEQNRLRRLA